MKCIVCMTHVPDTASIIRIGADGQHIDETGIKWIVSPYDEYALEEALQLTEAKGGEVTVMTYGPQRAEAGLRECLARGAHNAVHILGGEKTLGDSFAIAKVLAAAIKDREFDVILVGVKGVGTDNSQVGQMLAELLDLPHVSNVVKVEWNDGAIVAEREVEGGHEVVESPLPAVLTAQKGLNEPRYAALKGIMAAKRKPVEKVDPSALGLDEDVLAGAEATYNLRSLELPPEKQAGKIIQGEDDPQAAAAELVKLLHEEAKAF
ncbi:MAG: electron transfer flavoprotein subunit beta/FixA family protein [Acidobacteria bacterium]|nr:electron transfer flavoprotein subunit beta/FixA family protein [Acidobacteriota bacterium]